MKIDENDTGALVIDADGTLVLMTKEGLRITVGNTWDEGFAAGWGAQHVAEKAFNPYRSGVDDED